MAYEADERRREEMSLGLVVELAEEYLAGRATCEAVPW